MLTLYIKKQIVHFLEWALFKLDPVALKETALQMDGISASLKGHLSHDKWTKINYKISGYVRAGSTHVDFDDTSLIDASKQGNLRVSEQI